jgi:hypothetical protein
VPSGVQGRVEWKPGFDERRLFQDNDRPHQPAFTGLAFYRLDAGRSDSSAGPRDLESFRQACRGSGV